MNCKFLTINIDDWGTNGIEFPEGCIDYSSDETSADFLGENKKILLRAVSKFRGHASNTVRDIYNQNINQ